MVMYVLYLNCLQARYKPSIEMLLNYHRGQNDYKIALYRENVLVHLFFTKNTKGITLQSKSLGLFLAKGTRQWQQHCKENHLVEFFL